jgi:hypothetical protein
METALPEAITEGATLQGNEYGWRVDAFPRALQAAPELGYACLGGQFQFRSSAVGTCEMYWIDADSDQRLPDEGWGAFCKRSCGQVQQKFERRMASTDFEKEAADWPNLAIALKDRLLLDEVLVFVAYFVSEPEWLNDSER